MRTLRLILLPLALLLLTAWRHPAFSAPTDAASKAGDGVIRGHLIFCNEPERMRLAGAYADQKLQAGHTYTIFFHYHCVAEQGGDFVVALHGNAGQRFRFVGRQGFADPQRDPPMAGRQAMARYLSAPERDYRGVGGARFGYRLGPHETASGILTVCAESDARLRIYFKHDQYTVPHSSVLMLDTPHHEQEVDLTSGDGSQTFRIGNPETSHNTKLDGAYGILYAFHIQAPPGRKVRISFSPRGGKGGLVGSLDGKLLQTGICPATHWGVYCETATGKNGVRLTTAPVRRCLLPGRVGFSVAVDRTPNPRVPSGWPFPSSRSSLLGRGSLKSLPASSRERTL